MHTLHLQPTEHQVLVETLAKNIADLERETANKNTDEFRESLRSRLKTLESILGTLRSQPDLESEAVYPPSI